MIIDNNILLFFYNCAQCLLLGTVAFYVLYFICDKKLEEMGGCWGGGSPEKLCQHEGWRPGPQYPYECQIGIVACETSCFGGLGVWVRSPASLYVVESDWGRNRMSTSGLHAHMHTHLSTYINIHANMHIFHTQMTKMELNCYFEFLQFNTLLPIYT